jgi:hypothetical protein
MKYRAIVFVILGMMFSAHLQAADTSLHGTVTAGPSHVPLSNVRVVLREGTREQATSTDVQGNYEFLALDPAAAYTIVAETAGLHSFMQMGIVIGGRGALRVDVNLEMANVHSTVIVTEGLINLDAASAEVSQTIDSTEVEELPSVTRAATKFALLDPHVFQPFGLGADFTGGSRLSINGASYRHTSYMLDGTTNYDWIYANGPQAIVAVASVDTVKALTGNYSAQYGNSTSGVIMVNTESGTDAHHGELFTYIRPSGIQGTPALATFHMPNQKLDWGALAGGPLIKDRTFYFASYERVQQVRGAYIKSPAVGFFSGQINEYSGLLKIDHNLTRKNTLSTRLNGNHYASDNTDDRIADINNSSYGRTQRIQSWGGQISDQAVIGNSVNVARFAYTSYVPDSARPTDVSTGVVVPNYLQAGNSTYSWVHAQSETASDLLAFRRGRHDLKIGFEFEHAHARDYSRTLRGTYYYYTAADYLSQNPYKYMQTYGTADVRYGQKELSAFIQDDIRLTRRLTANLGARYEFQSLTDSHHNIGPRIGLAWDATGDGKTVVRAGGGMFFDQYYMYLIRRFITMGPKSPQYNYTWDCTANPNPCPAYPNSVESPSNGTQTPTLSYLYIPADRLLNPYSLQFSASVEREIAHNTVATLSLLQVHTAHQMRVNDINHPTPFIRTAPGQWRDTNASKSVIAANATRPYTTYDGVSNVTLIDRIENTASSIYQSMDLSIKSRAGRWGEAEAHYLMAGSYAYAMFYADYNSGVPNEWLAGGWDKAERGPSDFYQRHHLVADAILHGPYKTTLSLVGNFGSGLPVNPITGVDNNGDGYTVDRPVGMGRNSFHAPMQKTVDAAVAKKFSLRKKLNIETRIEALNALNSKNFITVNNTYGNGATPTSSFLAPKAGVENTNPSRQLQFAVRLLF